MRKIFTMLASACIAASFPAFAADNYHLVWQENFNGDQLNTSVWNYEIGNGDGGWGNAELQYYTPECAYIQDGSLNISAIRASMGSQQFISARITTKDKMYFTHGKIEIRAWMPKTANGVWPAMWGLGQDIGQVGWPKCGEIDFVEMGNAGGIQAGTQDRFFNGACHWGYYKNGGYPNYANSVTAPYSMQDGYHLYTIVWDDEKISMYYDLDLDPNRAPYYEMGLTAKDDDWGTYYYFHKPIFLVFNVAVGGRFTGILNPSGITALPDNGSMTTMKVDYIKLYQNDGANDTFYSTNGAGEPEAGLESTLSTPALDISYSAGMRSVVTSHEADSIAVYDTQGHKVAETVNATSLPVDHLSHGIYVAVAVSPHGSARLKFAIH